jgi:hypothetical protein
MKKKKKDNNKENKSKEEEDPFNESFSAEIIPMKFSQNFDYVVNGMKIRNNEIER